MVQERTIVVNHLDPHSISGEKLIISLKEAQKLLGKESKNLTNGELEKLTIDAETVVRVAMQEFLRSKIFEERSKVIKAGIKASKAKKS